jgi:hypothetical protein
MALLCCHLKENEINLFKDEAQTALVKDPVRTAQ